MKILKRKKQASKAPKVLKTPKLNTNLVLVKPKKHTHAYYGCLAEKARQGCLKGKITDSCKECKEKGAGLALSRQQEIKTLALAYKQLGLSITQLLKN